MPTISYNFCKSENFVGSINYTVLCKIHLHTLKVDIHFALM